MKSPRGLLTRAFLWLGLNAIGAFLRQKKACWSRESIRLLYGGDLWTNVWSLLTIRYGIWRFFKGFVLAWGSSYPYICRLFDTAGLAGAASKSLRTLRPACGESGRDAKDEKSFVLEAFAS